MTLSAEQTMARALVHHRAGQLDDAAGLYRGVLAGQPRHAEALHLLGVVHDARGEPGHAASLIEAALRVRESAAFRCNLAMVLGHLGRHAEAVAAAGRALALRPDYPEASNNLGVSLDRLGRRGQAVAAFGRAVAARPDYAEAWTNLGHALRGQGRPGEAAAAYERALALNPAAPRAPLGRVLGETGRYPEAATAFRHDLAARPDDPDTLNSLAVALAEAPAAAHDACGRLLGWLGRLDEAAAACRRAIALRPDLAEAHGTLGNVLRLQGRHAEAETALRRALALRPADAGAYNNLALVLDEQDRPHEALAVLDLGDALRPGDADTRHHRAMLLLRQGRFAEGWPEYEWRLRTRQAGGTGAPSAKSSWNGEPLRGRTILLTPEQGFGDTIQFSRYAPMVAAAGGRVLLGAPRPLVRLLRGLPGVAAVVAEGEAVPAHALECPLLSLPRAFGTTLETVPATVPYLAAPPEVQARWRERLPDCGGFRVGLAWAGNPNQANDRRRSLPFEALAPLWAMEGVGWYSLQVGPRAADLAAAPAGRIEDLAPELDDFAETAAAIARLDVVVTPDTAVAHLAGALGVPVLVMLSFAADWRWVRGQDRSPWYPGMRLVRQDVRRHWEPVVATIASMLADLRRPRVSGRG